MSKGLGLGKATRKKKRTITPTIHKKTRREVLKENKSLKENLVAAQKKNQQTFQSLFILAINFYKVHPDHDIFTSGHFTEEFIEMIKKSIKAQEEAKIKSAEAKEKADVS